MTAVQVKWLFSSQTDPNDCDGTTGRHCPPRTTRIHDRGKQTGDRPPSPWRRAHTAAVVRSRRRCRHLLAAAAAVAHAYNPKNSVSWRRKIIFKNPAARSSPDRQSSNRHNDIPSASPLVETPGHQPLTSFSSSYFFTTAPIPLKTVFFLRISYRGRRAAVEFFSDPSFEIIIIISIPLWLHPCISYSRYVP